MNMECAFQSPNKLYFVQDLMDGGDLHFNMMHRTRRRTFDEKRVVWYAACCLLGLQELHSLGILHRDIKPANMLLDKVGYAKLADFGLCGRLDTNGFCRARGGTLSFMSPESRNKSRRGRHGVGHDFFGLGVMIFVMFTCQYPFSKFGNFNTVIQAHLSELSLNAANSGEVGDPLEDAPNRQPEGGKISSYDEGSDHARSSTAMRDAALELEAKALPAHYVLDQKTLKKLPSAEARDLCRSLLMMNEKYRLGNKGAEQVMKHKFFAGVDWEGMKKRTTKPPSIPDTTRASVATGEMDLMKMLGTDDDSEYSKVKLSDEDQLVFKDFGYNPYLHKNKEKVIPVEEHEQDDDDDGSKSVDDRSEKDSENERTNEGGDKVPSTEPPSSTELGGFTSFTPLVTPAKRNSLADLGGITEERIDSRTGVAITSENPMDQFPASKATTPKSGSSEGGSFSERSDDNNSERTDIDIPDTIKE
jgi:serine/threonine protein kinase